jgi:SRSO17 transposase
LEECLRAFLERYAHFYRTQTRDTSHCGLRYLAALLRFGQERNFARIDRLAEKDGQQMQRFMSNSPWSARALLGQVRRDIARQAEFQAGGWLLLDESCAEKASEQSIEAGRQYNGRLGKVEMNQTGGFLAFSTGHEWLWVDGELFLPEAWFEKSGKEWREPVRAASGAPVGDENRVGGVDGGAGGGGRGTEDYRGGVRYLVRAQRLAAA